MMNGPGFVTTFLYYFSLSTLLGCFVAAQGMGVPYNSPSTVVSGLMLGVFAGALGAILNRSAALELPLPETKREATVFQQQLDKALAKLRFELCETDAETGRQVYQNMLGWSVLTGRIYLERSEESIRVVGRVSTIKRLKASL